jgi:multiple sugar transport system permease protein
MLAEIEAVAPVWHGPVTVERQASWRRVAGLSAPYLYALPALLAFAIWVYRPLVQTVRYSFLKTSLLPGVPEVSVGWANYHRVFELPQIRQAVGTTGFYVVGMMVFGVLLPLAAGAFLHQVGPRAASIYRGILFLPALIAPLIAGTIWSFMLAPNGGLVNAVIGWAHIGARNWLLDLGTARYAVVAIAGWKILGISVLIVAAGLAAISPDYYEAAAIDGASRWRTFRELTLPLLSPTLLFLVTIAVLISESAMIFPLLNSLTQGGPAGATTDIYYLLYQFGFTSFDVGLASAAATIFFLAFGALAIFCIWVLDKLSFHDE